MTKTIDINPSQNHCLIEGKPYPIVGYGTYPLREKECEEAVTVAIESGFRIIDTATFYFNLDAIGNVLTKDCYVISKVWPDKHSPSDLKADLENTLNKLKIDCLDAYLLHWPDSRISIKASLEMMETLRREGKVRHLGISNPTVNHLKKALNVGITLEWIQVEMNPYFYDPVLLDFCRSNKIAVTAWAPLGRGRISDDKLLEKLSEKYQKTKAQIALRWIVEHGCLPLSASKNPTHIKDNLAITDFNLAPDEMKKIDERAKNGERVRITKENDLGFTDEFDFTYDECWPMDP